MGANARAVEWLHASCVMPERYGGCRVQTPRLRVIRMTLSMYPSRSHACGAPYRVREAHLARR